MPIAARDGPMHFAHAVLRLFTTVPCVGVPVEEPTDTGFGLVAFRPAIPANPGGHNGESPWPGHRRLKTLGFLSADGVAHPLARWARLEHGMEIAYHDARRPVEFGQESAARVAPANVTTGLPEVVCITLPLAGGAEPALAALDRAALESKTLLLAWQRAPAIEKIATYISEHSTESVRLPDLAAMVGLSRYYLVRRFATVVGVTPHRLHLMFRIADALALLRSGAQIGDVAQSVGFSDQSHLNRHFRALVGLTPGQYQKFVNNAISSKTLPRANI